MKISEVFTAGGVPSITYNARSEYQLEENLELDLEIEGKILSITGPTKIGKSTLCKKVIPIDKLVSVPCGGLKNIDDLWSTIITKLSLANTKVNENESEKTKTNTNELTVGTEAGFLNWLKAKVEGKQQKANATREATRTQTVFEARPLDLAIEGLIQNKSVLVLDDFHYCTKELQTEIIRSLKDPLSIGLKIIICSVPHRDEDSIKVEHELEGRILQFRISQWSPQELKEISMKGFTALNLQVPVNIINSFVNESYKSPHLMQEFCYRYCRWNNIFEKQVDLIHMNDAFNLETFYSQLINTFSSKFLYEKLVSGPDRERKMRQLKNGSEGDIYYVIMLALSELTHFDSITPDIVREKLKELLEATSMPNKQQVQQVLSKMTDIAKTSTTREPSIDFQENKLFIVDPFFAFYLKWCEK